MESPTWGDVVQSMSTVLVAIVFGWWVNKRYLHRSSVKTVLCRELQAIVDDVQAFERRIAALYDKSPADTFAEIIAIISAGDTSRRRIEIVHYVLTRKLTDAQLPEFLAFHTAYRRFDHFLRALDSYFTATQPHLDKDARHDINEPVHTMI